MLWKNPIPANIQNKHIYIYISKEIRVVILLPIMSDKLLLTIPENNMNYLLPYVSTVHDSLLQRLLANNTSNWNYTEQKFLTDFLNFSTS